MARTSVVSRIAHDRCLDAAAEPLGPAWWQQLDSGFYKRDEDFELNLRDRALVGATAAIDVGIRTFAAGAVSTLAAPFGLHPGELAHLEADRSFYAERTASGRGEDLFQAPARRVSVQRRRALAPLFSPKDGVVEDISFESPFQPTLPRLRPAWQRHTRNRRVVARIWRHTGAPRPVVLAIHGFGAEQSWVNEWMLALPRLYRLGCDVALLTLPFHGPRADLLSPFSGHGFFSGGLSWINEAFAQGVLDARVLMQHLSLDCGAPRIGATGISLGGCTTALLASAEPTLAFALPIVPVTSLADLMLEWRPLSAAISMVMRQRGLTIHDLRHALSPCSPLTYEPQVPFHRRMIVGGVGDRVAPPKHSRLLWEHWERCRLHWFPGGHVLHLDKGEYVLEMGRFLRDADFLPDRPIPGR